MPDYRRTTVFILTPLIFRYHLPLKPGSKSWAVRAPALSTRNAVPGWPATAMASARQKTLGPWLNQAITSKRVTGIVQPLKWGLWVVSIDMIYISIWRIFTFFKGPRPFKGTVRPDGIYMRVVPLDRLSTDIGWFFNFTLEYLKRL